MGSFNGDFSAVRFHLHTKSSMFKEIHLTIFLGVVINNFSVYTGDWGYLCVWVLSFVGLKVCEPMKSLLLYESVTLTPSTDFSDGIVQSQPRRNDDLQR